MLPDKKKIWIKIISHYITLSAIALIVVGQWLGHWESVLFYLILNVFAALEFTVWDLVSWARHWRKLLTAAAIGTVSGAIVMNLWMIPAYFSHTLDRTQPSVRDYVLETVCSLLIGFLAMTATAVNCLVNDHQEAQRVQDTA